MPSQREARPAEGFTLTREEADFLVKRTAGSASVGALLKLFAEHQIVSCAYVRRRLEMTQSGINGVLGQLTKLFAEASRKSDACFYIWIEGTNQWAIGSYSWHQLRDAFREAGVPIP